MLTQICILSLGYTPRLFLGRSTNQPGLTLTLFLYVSFSWKTLYIKVNTVTISQQVQAFRSLEFYICYYGWGDFIRRTNTCSQSNIFEAFYFVVAIIPYWIRTLQVISCGFNRYFSQLLQCIKSSELRFFHGCSAFGA